MAFVRSAQVELLWINQREELEATRNWSDVGQLDLPMLQNYYKQLLHEVELREEQFNSVSDDCNMAAYGTIDLRAMYINVAGAQSRCSTA